MGGCQGEVVMSDTMQPSLADEMRNLLLQLLESAEQFLQGGNLQDAEQAYANVEHIAREHDLAELAIQAQNGLQAIRRLKLLAEGNAALKARRLLVAQAAFREVYENVAPGDEDAARGLTEASFLLGQQAEAEDKPYAALEYYEQALEVDPGHESAAFRRQAIIVAIRRRALWRPIRTIGLAILLPLLAIAVGFLLLRDRIPGIVKRPTAAIPSPTTTPTSVPSRIPTLTPTLASFLTSPPTLTPTSSPSPTPILTPTLVPTPVPTYTPTPTPTPTARPMPTSTPTLTSTPTPTATPVWVAPARLEPLNDFSTEDMARFRWIDSGPLPSGVYYEVVIWREGENPTEAQGIAAAVRDTQLNVHFAAVSHVTRGSYYWTVILVRREPSYQRLTEPVEGWRVYISKK